MAWLYGVIAAIIAAVFTVATMPFARVLARRTGAIDYPSERRVNKMPIPRLGGVAMFCGTCAACLFLWIGSEFLGWQNYFTNHPVLDVNYWGLICSAVVMFGVGLIDDITCLNPKVKLLGQIIAACIAVCSGLLLTGFYSPFGSGYLDLGIWAYPLTVFYLVAFANIINLIDGLDGLASGITAISALAIMTLSFMMGHYAAALICLILVGACVGFLRFNFHPASIFMGDGGSLFLGFVLGCASLLAVAKSTLFVSLLVPILAAGIPIIDTASAIIRRIRGHRPIDEADKGHLHHRLLEAGHSQRSTVLIMWAWTAVLSLCGILIVQEEGLLRWGIILIVVGLTVFVIVRFRILKPVLAHCYDGPRGAAKANDAVSHEAEGEASGESAESAEQVASGTSEGERR